MNQFRKPIPEKVRFAVYLRSGGVCECCGEKRALELHHKRYFVDVYPPPEQELIFGKEEEYDLEALCRECHLSAHTDLAGQFWRDPEEMDEHWAGYFHELYKD